MENKYLMESRGMPRDAPGHPPEAKNLIYFGEKCGEIGARRAECELKLFDMIGLEKSRAMSGVPLFPLGDCLGSFRAGQLPWYGFRAISVSSPGRTECRKLDVVLHRWPDALSA